MPPREGVYGLLAEFNTPSELVHATEMAHRAGYRRMECYTPYLVEEAAEALRFHKTRVPLVCLLGGLIGILAGHFGLQLVVYFLATKGVSWPAEASPTVIVIAFLVSGIVGLIFGLYPAWKASRLDPIEALRYE